MNGESKTSPDRPSLRLVSTGDAAAPLPPPASPPPKKAPPAPPRLPTSRSAQPPRFTPGRGAPPIAPSRPNTLLRRTPPADTLPLGLTPSNTPPAHPAEPTGALPSRWWTTGQDPVIPTKTAEAEVRRENRAAAMLSPLDARWLLAVRVSQTIDGGRAAILTPDRRRQLVALGDRLGLRPFDTNLIIAIVQDAARTGEDVRRRLSEEVQQRLTLVAPPAPLADKAATRDHVPLIVGRLLAAAALAVILTSFAIRWLTA